MFTVNVGNLYRWNGSPLVLFHGENLVHLLLQVLVCLLRAEWSAQPYYGCTGEEETLLIFYTCNASKNTRTHMGLQCITLKRTSTYCAECTPTCSQKIDKSLTLLPNGNVPDRFISTVTYHTPVPGIYTTYQTGFCFKKWVLVYSRYCTPCIRAIYDAVPR
jgi:hypothetical protein